MEARKRLFSRFLSNSESPGDYLAVVRCKRVSGQCHTLRLLCHHSPTCTISLLLSGPFCVFDEKSRANELVKGTRVILILEPALSYLLSTFCLFGPLLVSPAENSATAGQKLSSTPPRLALDVDSDTGIFATELPMSFAEVGCVRRTRKGEAVGHSDLQQT